MNRTGLKVHRRQFLQTAVAASRGLSLSAFGQVTPPQEGTVCDKLWLFSNPTNEDYPLLRRRSVMSPFEAAVYMGIPNIMMVNGYNHKGPDGQPGQDGWFQTWTPPLLEQFALPLTLLKRVAWSIVGDSGITIPEERQAVLALARNTPNIVGLYMDDFFHDEPGRELAALSLDQLREIHGQIKVPGKKMDLYVTFYTRQLNLPIAEYLKLIDVITIWIWNPEDLSKLNADLARLEQLAPHSRKMLGLYMVALNEHKTPAWTGMPIPLMQMQCEKALDWLHRGKIEGIIVYGGTTLDLGFEAVDWTREWIRRVRDTKLG